MSFANYFDRALCINLDRRPDRWRDSQMEFSKIGLGDVTRIRAIDGDSIPTVANLKPGANGCRLSHAKAFHHAKTKQYNSFLLLEDDVEFNDAFNEMFNFMSPRIPDDWDIIYLCANPATGNRRLIDDNIFKVQGVYAAHCVIFKNTVYENILDRLLNDFVQADLTYGEIQKQCNAYLLYPHLAYQRSDFSDIEKEVVDYGLFRV